MSTWNHSRSPPHTPTRSSASHLHPPTPPASSSSMPDPWGSASTSSLRRRAGGGVSNEREESEDLENKPVRNGLDTWRVHGWAVDSLATSLPTPSTSAAHVSASLVPDTVLTSYPVPVRPGPGRSASPPRVFQPFALEVWAGVMDSSKGRDKVLKCVQYTLRTYLYLLNLIGVLRPLSRWFRANRTRTQLAVNALSMTRKCLLLFNPLRPTASLLSPEPTSARALVGHLIDLASTVADDVYCLSRLGLISRRRGKVADRWANRLWLLTTLTSLYALHVRILSAHREQGKEAQVGDRDHATGEVVLYVPDKRAEIEWTRRKLLCDLIFVSYDVFHLTWAKEPVQCVTGLIAGLISTGQLYSKEQRALNKEVVV